MKKILEILRSPLGKENGFKQAPKWMCFLFVILALWGMLHFVALFDSWTVRMTVVIDTPEGPKAGSSVWRIIHHSEPSFFPAQGGSFYKIDEGEAVVIDLGKRGTVFALLRGADGDADYGYHVALKVFPQRDNTPAGTQTVLDSSQYPMFVRFQNMDDPMTIENVYGTESMDKAGNPPPQGRVTPEMFRTFRASKADRFEQRLGAGVRVEKITLEVTDDSVSLQLKRHLPWLSKIRDRTLEGKTSTGLPLYSQLYTWDFLRGD